ncbi:hypothetical protein [Loigolactobacillus backii]|nr:hypothetical protein [Loigolactobacillus backii]
MKKQALAIAIVEWSSYEASRLLAYLAAIRISVYFSPIDNASKV